MEVLSLIVSILALAYILITTPVRGLGRFLSPDVTAMTMLVAIFGVRPVFSNRFDEGAWYSRYIPTIEGESIALLVGIVSMVAFAAGVTIARQRISTKNLAAFNTDSDKRYIRFTIGHVVFFSTIGVFAYIAALILFAGPHIFSQLKNGRSADVSIGGTPEIVMLLPLTATVAVALFLLAHKHRKLRRLEIVLLLLAVSTSLALVSQLGNRRFIIPAILIPIIAALIRRPTRVKLWHIPASVAAVILLATIPMVRAAGARRPGENLLTASWRYFQEEGFYGVLRPVFVSYDTEMFDYIAVIAPQLQEINYGLGRGTVVEFATRPLPQSWNSSPAWSEVLLTKLFGGGCGDPVCPVASLPGVLFFEGGLIAVALGCFIAGMFLRTVAVKWQSNIMYSIRTQLCVVIISSFALVAFRTNTVHAAWWIIYAILIAFFVHLFAGERGRRPVSYRHFVYETTPLVTSTK